MDELLKCPSCQYEYTYPEGQLWKCPECLHSWDPNDQSDQDQTDIVMDANGNKLEDGDTVTVIKDLKIKGASSSVKVGTKVKNIRLNPGGADGHNISCKVPGIGALDLKSKFVKKVR